MSVFRSKVFIAFALMSFISMGLIYTNTRIIVTTGTVQLHLDSENIDGQSNISKMKDIGLAITDNISSKSQMLLSGDAWNVYDSRKLLGDAAPSNSLIADKNQNSSNVTKDLLNTNFSNMKYLQTRTSLNVNKQNIYAPSVQIVHKHKIRIVTYHIYHTLLKWAAAKLDMKKCYHSSNCEVIYHGKCSTDPIQADAIVFQGNNMPRDKPSRLHTDQVFVYLNIESPQYLQIVKLSNPFLKEFFNWTMTYRRDSDIPYLYGSVLPRSFNKTEYLSTAERTNKFLNYADFQLKDDLVDFNTDKQRKNYKAIFRRKTQSSVWFVSHCLAASRRDQYVSRMMKFTDIDVFGKCSNSTNACPKHNPHCGDHVKHIYKFFFAFENSMCEDYITEKVFRWFSEDIIVVVRGARFYKRYLPKGTYVDADDFASPEDLAKYLTRLGSDEEEYLNYLKRKDNFTVISEDEHVQLAYCNLCYKLNNLELYRKPANQLNNWWNSGRCTKPNI